MSKKSTFLSHPHLSWNYREQFHECKERSQHDGNRPKPLSPIIVMVTWMFCKEKNVKAYVKLYHACGWDVLVCYSPVVSLWFPTKGRILAMALLKKLNEELALSSRIVVFAVFSGGVKTCFIELIKCLLHETAIEADTILLRSCVKGFIFDSCPIDFVSSLGVKFLSSLGKSKKESLTYKITRFGTKTCANFMDFLFSEEFERQRIEQWNVLKEVGRMGQLLLLFGENDELAPHQDIKKYAKTVKESGGKVEIVCWKESAHVGHIVRHAEEYRIAISSFLGNLTATQLNQVPCFCPLCRPISKL